MSAPAPGIDRIGRRERGVAIRADRYLPGDAWQERWWSCPFAPLSRRGQDGDDRGMTTPLPGQPGPRPRTVVIVVFDEVQSLDVTGPLEVFTAASLAAAHTGGPAPGYRVLTASLDGRPVTLGIPPTEYRRRF
jgi:hypothetical protein